MTDRSSYESFPRVPGSYDPVVADAAAAAAWQRTDAALDRIWLLLHPTEASLTRPATALERVAYGLPGSAYVVAVPAPGGVRWAFVVTIPRPESAAAAPDPAD